MPVDTERTIEMTEYIIQIGNKPIDKDDYIEESGYYDSWLLGSVADYVSDVPEEDYDEIIEAIGSRTGIETVKTEDGWKIRIKDIKSYFSEKYRTFMAKCEEMKDLTLEQFASYEFGYEAYSMYKFANDKYDLYLDRDGLINIDGFLREAKDGDEYYIGGIVSYHC